MVRAECELSSGYRAGPFSLVTVATDAAKTRFYSSWKGRDNRARSLTSLFWRCAPSNFCLASCSRKWLKCMRSPHRDAQIFCTWPPNCLLHHHGPATRTIAKPKCRVKPRDRTDTFQEAPSTWRLPESRRRWPTVTKIRKSNFSYDSAIP